MGRKPRLSTYYRFPANCEGEVFRRRRTAEGGIIYDHIIWQLAKWQHWGQISNTMVAMSPEEALEYLPATYRERCAILFDNPEIVDDGS